MFIVMCQRDGGPSGFGQAPLKEKDSILYFDTRAEAQIRADELNRSMNNRYSIATFKYWVEEN